MTPHSWLCGKNCGRSSAPKFGQGRIIITILECTFPEENVNGACSGKNTNPVARSGWLGLCARWVARVYPGWLLGRCEAVARMFWVVLGHFSGSSYTIESQWGNFGTLLPPRGATFTPFGGMVLKSLPASSNVCKFHIYVKSTL